MIIMSFNTQHCLNYITKEIDFDCMAQAITACGADVVGLNEMRGEGPSPCYMPQVERLKQLTGLKYHYFAKATDVPGGGPYGNGLLSKYPIFSHETIPIPDPIKPKYSGYYESRCILKAVLEGGITVLVTHFGLNPDEQENAVSTVLTMLEQERTVLMGDFNLPPKSRILAPIRKKLTDTALYFSSPLLSFPSDKPERKIDYIFVTPDIKVIKADIPPIVASDHRPHIAEIII